MLATAHRDKVLKLARRRQGVTAGDLSTAGIHRQVLTRMVAAGELKRVMRGVYRLPSQVVATQHHGLVLACVAVPQGTICLLSALQFHGIGTQLPSEVWMAIDRRARKSAPSYPPLRILRFGGEALVEGVERPRIEGQSIRVYGVAKTVADCFKYRNKIGIDVAVEALRSAWQGRRFSMEELDHYSRICRVQKVMQPYLESLLA